MRISRYLCTFLLAVLFLSWLYPTSALAYPLDGTPDTGIKRLEGYGLVQADKVRGRLLFPGSLLPTHAIQLKLLGQPGFRIPSPDPQLTAQLKRAMGSESTRSYSITLLDLSDPGRPRYAEINPHMQVAPASVGKILVALGMFQTLADIYPNNTSMRNSILKNTMEEADQFIIRDSHDVPFWQPGQSSVTQRPIRQGDKANLWTFLDWMMSSSSNAAAAMVQKNMVLLQHYGRDYPRPRHEMNAFLARTPKSELKKLFSDAIIRPISRNGLNSGQLRQGSFFTRRGKQLVPGVGGSTASSRALLEYLVRMEKGQLVDHFSSLAIKRLLYLTERRIRYASSPALGDSAVFFKSGSLYKCRGGGCGKYKGNVQNVMNSVAIVESINRDVPLNYMAVVISNVLGKNSATFHQALAGKIHRIMAQAYPGSQGAVSHWGSGGGGSGSSGARSPSHKEKEDSYAPSRSPLGGVGYYDDDDDDD